MDTSEVAFISSFLPCSFEGFEMSMFWALSSIKDKRMANIGALSGVIAVVLMLYSTYLILPILISDTSEYFLKLLLGFIFISLATFFLYKDDYPEPKTAFLTSFLGIIAEGIEVDLFSVSSWIMTGSYMGIVGGLIGFIWSLIIFKEIVLKISRKIMKYIAVGILYTVAFIILTSGII
ncbi:hypothetical protein SJAV_19240 [Sulfurisphaera javensis]|uniref:Uncharacterized protein n=1 Tax=Sulfurisphaera javensis TaxID=2049879 RepID=A0AAT9GTF5_9CREN